MSEAFLPTTSSARPGLRNRPWMMLDAVVDLQGLLGNAADLGQGVRVGALVVEGRDDHHLAAHHGAAFHVPGDRRGRR